MNSGYKLARRWRNSKYGFSAGSSLLAKAYVIHGADTARVNIRNSVSQSLYNHPRFCTPSSLRAESFSDRIVDTFAGQY